MPLLEPLRVNSCLFEFFSSDRPIQMAEIVYTVFCNSIHASLPMYNPFELKSSDQPQPSACDAGKVLLAFVVGIGPI